MAFNRIFVQRRITTIFTPKDPNPTFDAKHYKLTQRNERGAMKKFSVRPDAETKREQRGDVGHHK